VEEVAIGPTTVQPGASSATLYVQVRAAQHRTPSHATPGTALLTGRQVKLRYFVNEDPTVVNASPATTVSGGIGSFTLSSLPLNANVRLEAWMEPSGTSGSFDRDRVAWSTAHIPVGVVVNVTALPDVGDDKYTTSIKRAKFRFTRTGSTAQNLQVFFSLPPENALRAPVSNEDLIAKYGTTGTADYYFVPAGQAWFGPTIVQGGTLNSIWIPTGSTEAVAEVVTRADNVTEEDVVRVELQPGTGYVRGSQTVADVLIYDGPEWTIYELGAYRSGNGNTQNAKSTSARALNSASSSPAMRYAGGAAFDSSGLLNLPASSVGGYWTAGPGGVPSALSDIWSTSAGGTGPLVVGIADNGYMVATSAYRGVRHTGSSFAYLPNLHNGQGQTGEALGISPNAAFIVGSSQLATGVRRPAFWTSSLQIIDLASQLDVSWAGTARAVNNVGSSGQAVCVGDMEMSFDVGSTRWRGFRTRPGVVGVYEVQDRLLAPSEPPTGLPDESLDSAAYAVNSAMSFVTVIAHAAGSYTDPFSGPTSCFWGGRDQNGLNPVGVSLGHWRSPVDSQVIDLRSEARGINNLQWIVGWSQSLSKQRAVFKRSSSAFMRWMDLNDKHLVYGLSGWDLHDAVAINNSGHIVGNGVKSGLTRGFVLIRRGDEN